MAQGRDSGIERAYIPLARQQIRDDTIRLVREAVRRVLHRLAKLRQNVDATCPHQWVCGTAPLSCDIEHFSCTQLPQLANSVPWSVALIIPAHTSLRCLFAPTKGST